MKKEHEYYFNLLKLLPPSGILTLFNLVKPNKTTLYLIRELEALDKPKTLKKKLK